MRHRESGVFRSGYIGFSWTTCFFGSLPALFRSDFVTFLGSLAVYFALGFFTFGIGAFLAGFI